MTQATAGPATSRTKGWGRCAAAVVNAVLSMLVSPPRTSNHLSTAPVIFVRTSHENDAVYQRYQRSPDDRHLRDIFETDVTDRGERSATTKLAQRRTYLHHALEALLHLVSHGRNAHSGQVRPGCREHRTHQQAHVRLKGLCTKSYSL